MRYFQIGNNWCRALKFDKQLLGSNKEKLHSHNVFVRNINPSWNHPDLHEKYQKFGPIKSLEISNNTDGSSRGYGFICYQDEASAVEAVAATCND
jgi:polyadenylate-binding protein